MNVNQLLDRHFLEVRARLLEIAATLDRIDRGKAQEDSNATDPSSPVDPRLAQLRQGIELLLGDEEGRAARIQRLFSLGYDPDWRTKYQL